MKKILISLAVLGMIAILAGVISYTTPTRSTQFLVQHIQSNQGNKHMPEATAKETMKKKPCDCCKERIARLQEQIRKARERRQATLAAETQARGAEQTP